MYYLKLNLIKINLFIKLYFNAKLNQLCIMIHALIKN